VAFECAHGALLLDSKTVAVFQNPDLIDGAIDHALQHGVSWLALEDYECYQ